MTLTHWPWAVVALLWILTTSAIMNTSQGLYEDTAYVHALEGAKAPRLTTMRGLSKWTLWYQITHNLTPSAIRAWNVRLALIVALLVGLLAHQLGLCAWAATGLMIVHPMTSETIAMMTGRAELISAVGVLIACLGATLPLKRGLLISVCGLMLGLFGKESAIVSFALVPFVALVSRPSRGWMWASALGVLGLCVAAWSGRHVGWTNDIHGLSPWPWALTQSAAAWRLIIMLVIPRHQTVDYDYDQIGRLWSVAASCCLVSVAWIAWHLKRLAPIVSLSLAWLLVIALPRIIVQTPKSYLHEYQWYLAIPAAALLFAYGVTQAQEWACSETA